PAGKDLLSQLPPPNSASREYAVWSEKALGLIKSEQELLLAESPILDEKVNQTTQKLTDLTNASWGLSAYIHLDELNAEIKPAHATRSSPLFAFVGGVLALLGSAAFWLALIERQLQA
ncbi:MAG: hypothetical protein ACPL4H_10050, partial [Anaerolineales bacterium]